MKAPFWIILGFLGLIACTPPVVVDTDDTTGTSNLPDTTMKNVSYGSHARQVYDVYLPAKRDINTPCIVMIHGGAWKAGQKEDMNNFVNLIQKSWKNVAIVNINYRLASNTDSIHHEEIITDIDAAIAHVLNQKTAYNISSKMGIVGASAGGQLAMIYAYKYNHHNNIQCVGNIFGPSIINDWSWYNSNNIWLGGKVGDILTEYVGQPWDTTAYKSVSPYWNITSNSQPTIIFHGNLDPIVPVYQSQWLNGKLTTLNVPHQYHEYVAFHGFDTNQSVDVVNKMVAFFKVHIK